MNGDSYRKGFREGWLFAINRMKELKEARALSFEEAYEICYEYRRRLHEWTLRTGNGAPSLSPPKLEE